MPGASPGITTAGPGATPTVTASCADAAAGAAIAATAAMASILFRMECSSCHGAGEANAFHAASFRERLAASAAFWGNFYEAGKRRECFASPPLDPGTVQLGPRNDSPRITGIPMVITSAHIPAIVALIAGLLIL